MSNDIPDKLSLACSIADRNRRHPFGNERSLSEGKATSTVDELVPNPASFQPVEVASWREADACKMDGIRNC